MTQTTQFTPTRMQKLLGRQYKWWYVTVYSIRLAQSSLVSKVFGTFANSVNFFAMLYIWFFNGNDPSIMTYLIVGRVYKTLTDNYWSDKISAEIIYGSLSISLLRPTDYMADNFFKSLRSRFVRNFVALLGVLIVSIIISFIGVKLLFGNILFLIFLLPIIIIINYLLTFIMGCVAFFPSDSRNYSSFAISYNQLSIIFIGSVIPLDVFPERISLFFSFLPFAWILHHPMQIYLGKYDTTQTLMVFVGGIAWCIILYFLAKLIFKLGLKRNEAVGL
jgi:ABC-2 type transport system permease protein